MMKILLVFLFIFPQSVFAKEAKTITMQTKVKQVRMLAKDKFQVEFFEYAAKYFSDEKKAVLLKVTAYKNQIVECEIKN